MRVDVNSECMVVDRKGVFAGVPMQVGWLALGDLVTFIVVILRRSCGGTAGKTNFFSHLFFWWRSKNTSTDKTPSLSKHATAASAAAERVAAAEAVVEKRVAASASAVEEGEVEVVVEKEWQGKDFLQDQPLVSQ